jgi:hypothetical protein
MCCLYLVLSSRKDKGAIPQITEFSSNICRQYESDCEYREHTFVESVNVCFD